MKKNKLDFEPEFDEFELIGLVTPIKEYKLAWWINKILQIKLVKQPDLIFDFINNSKLSISNYLHNFEYGGFRLVKNKAGDFLNSKLPFLLPELKQYDFLIKLEQISHTFTAKQVINQLKSVDQIIFIKELSVNELKSKENLIF